MNLNYPSEYIKKYGESKDFHSLENFLSAYKRREGWDNICQQALGTKDFDPIKDSDIFDIVFEYLAEIQFAERTLVKWKNF